MLFSLTRLFAIARSTHRKRSNVSLSVERLESRAVPANLAVMSPLDAGPMTFNVLNLSDSGTGSLRQAMLGANAHAGPDVIDFNVAGSIRLTTGALPAVTGTVNVDGSAAPGFAATPVVQINFNNFGGLVFNVGAAGSTLRSLNLVNAAGNGVTLNGVSGMLIAGNIIGLGLDGATLAGNSAHGLYLVNSSGNTIGGVNAADQNTISGNHANGIYLNGSSNNQILGNFIGTDATGTLDRGNAGNGIFVTAGANGNTIGGNATGGNDPTNGVFVRPPQGNLISGNDANGVLINAGATQNTLSGNFIGTAASGNSPLGNRFDGVDIVNANGNSLIGCTLTTDPFVYYNVISGNGANGLQVSNSNNTTIQANFFGLGANNLTAVGNALNGVLVEGSSSNTTMGGPIPLGNVDAANGQNGILVQGTASYFVSYNTFCGLAAFETYTNLGNGWDGMKITSTGGNILLRTNVITENGNDGIEISGSATGVRVAGNIIGLDTNGEAAMGNKNNGVEVDGAAHNILLGGPQPTFNIIPHNVISANGANGVAVTGGAHDVQVSLSDIGTNFLGVSAFGNARAGVFLGDGTYATTIGSLDPTLPTLISGNLGNGVEMRGTHGNTVVGSLIGTDITGLLPLPNGGAGVFLSSSSNNLLGAASTGANGSANIIAFNRADGVYVASGSGNAIRASSLFNNALLGIDLAAAANNNQAAPVLTSVQTVPLGLSVTGTLASTPNATFTLEFFGNNLNQPSGRYFLGSITVKTNAAGVAAFTFLGSTPPIGADFITATATNLNNGTSEFSAAQQIASSV